MKKYTVLGLAIVLGLAAAAVAKEVCERRRRRAFERLSAASEEGYELAHDIIFPDKYPSKRNKKLRYGPVF
ncbi:hypothetical protein [Niabella digestorum]|uniref:YtxH domain-containing protein n=1 Tax=Niabella digestorum TaxID=3117701 RepID=A0ABU7RH73_9BACT